MTNNCLRPASLGDAIAGLKRPQYESFHGWSGWHYTSDGVRYNYGDLEKLYDAEWKLRGFDKSP